MKTQNSNENSNEDAISRADTIKAMCADCEAFFGDDTNCADCDNVEVVKSMPPVEPKPVITEEVREALMRLTMCAREECSICKYENDCGYDKQVKMATENMNTILNVFLERPKGEWKCMADCGVTECDRGSRNKIGER